MGRGPCICIAIFFVAFFGVAQPFFGQDPAHTDSEQIPGSTIRLNLPKAVSMALEYNGRSKVSRAEVDAAMARHKQTLSAWWPELSAKLSASRMDEDANFLFPSSMVQVPASQFPIPPTTITIPANSFGPGFPPVDVPLQTSGMNLDIPAQAIPVPEQDIKLMDRDIAMGSLNLTYPIYTGGLRTSLNKMTKYGAEVAKQDTRRTDQEVVYDVRRVYYSGVLTHRLVQIAEDTLARMEATLELTEKLYQTGTGTVKKTDYLRNKSMVETIRSMAAELKQMHKTTLATLGTVIGLEWNQDVVLEDEDIPFKPGESDPETIMDRAFLGNPQIAKLEAAVKAAEAEVGKATSGHIPKVGFFASTNKIWNSLDTGMATPENKFSWAVGIGVEIPIFQGFRVTAEQKEARAKLQKRRHQLKLVQDSLALEVKNTCYTLEKAVAQQKASGEALKSATENRELNVRAYQEELVETKDVIEAQITEALIAGQYQKVLYEHVESQAKLDFVLGIDAAQLANANW